MEIVDGEQIDIVQQLNASNMMEDHFTFDLCKKGKIHFLLQGQIQDFSSPGEGNGQYLRVSLKMWQFENWNLII